jgi:outer membrane protein OmpA-like peptidoglycan-associated protein
MSSARLLMPGLSLLWLIVSVLVPAAGDAGEAQPLPSTSSQEQIPPPLDLRVPAPIDLRFQTLDLQSKTLPLRFRIEDLSGAVQALAINETEAEIKIILSGDVLFEFDRTDILPEAEATMLEVIDLIAPYAKADIAIDGYADTKGSDAYNRYLSEMRAAAVKNWLVQNAAVEGKRIKSMGWGKAKPAAPNTNPDGSDNPEGRQKNRRVEITVAK